MTDPRQLLWQKLGIAPRDNPSHESESPEGGVLDPERPGPGRAVPLFAPNTPLEEGPEHPGQLPPHYPVLDADGQFYSPEISARTPAPVRVPGMPGGNDFYDRFGTRRLTWRQAIEAEAHGTITPPAAGASSLISISAFTPTPLGLRVSQQPTTGRAYLVIRRFTAWPRTVADTGGLQWGFVDSGGQFIPLANTAANAGVVLDMATLTGTPFVEPNPASLGSLQLTTATGSVVAAIWDWSLAFSFAYVRSGILSKGDWP